MRAFRSAPAAVSQRTGVAVLHQGGTAARTCGSTAAGTAIPTAPRRRLVSIYEHATLSGIYTVALEAPPANVLSEALLRDLNGALELLAEASGEPGDAADLAVSKTSKKSSKREKTSAGDGGPSAADILRERNRPRGLILTSAVDGCFSGGLDLDVLASEPMVEPRTFAAYWHEFQSAWLALQRLPLPVVAAVNGNCPAAGCILAAACDARVMVRAANRGRQSRIGVTATRGGFAAPPWVAADLNRVVGSRTAERLLQGGELVTADEALRLGLVDDVVADVGTPETAADVTGAAAALENEGDFGAVAHMWATAEPRANCPSLAGRSLDVLLDWVETPRFAFWLTKETFRTPVTATLADSREGRAKDAHRFYSTITRPAAREHLLAYRATVGRGSASAKP